MNFSADTSTIDYVCSSCGAEGCKLWRDYQTFLENVSLLCGPCAGKKQDVDVSSLAADGLYTNAEGIRTDQIGWMVPAVLTEDQQTFWGYSSVPEEAIERWQALPTGV